MKAVHISRPGPPDVLELVDLPDPEPEHDQILVRVHASALNRADLLQREGKYPPPPGAPDTPGMEFAGEVVATGSSVRLWKPRNRVFGITAGGAHAELLVAHERAVARIPDLLGWTEAAAVPEAFITAHDALWTQAKLRPNERVLIHAVGSGVGLAAVQLCRAIGAVPFGTSRTQDKLEHARALGLEDGTTDLGSTKAFGNFDVVLDLVGGPMVKASVDALGMQGRLMLVGTVGGATGELELGKALYKRLTIIGTVLRSRPLEEKITATRLFASEVAPLFATGVLKPVVDSVFSLDRIREAHERLASNSSCGKVVITIA